MDSERSVPTRAGGGRVHMWGSETFITLCSALTTDIYVSLYVWQSSQKVYHQEQTLTNIDRV